MSDGGSQASRHLSLSLAAPGAAARPTDSMPGWSPVSGGGLRKTYAFPASAQVLMFSIRASELARAEQALIEVRQGFGKATVTVAGGAINGAHRSLIAAIDWVALAIQERRDEGV